MTNSVSPHGSQKDIASATGGSVAGPKINKTKDLKVKMRMMLAGKGHLIGWEDIVRGRKYSTTVRCFSKTGIVLRLSAQDFIQELKQDINAVKLILDVSSQRDL